MPGQVKIEEPRIQFEPPIGEETEDLFSEKRCESWFSVCRQAHHDVFIVIRFESQKRGDGRIELSRRMRKGDPLQHLNLLVVGPSSIEAFNNAAFGALASSNPTQPLPPEYPTDKAFFTVTFFYNEQPQ
jgi:hypothetical protein